MLPPRRWRSCAARSWPASVSMTVALGSSAASQLASFDDAVPAEVFTSRTRPSPAGAAGAGRGGLIAMAGLSRPPRPPAQGHHPGRGPDGGPGEHIRRVVLSRGDPGGAHRRGEGDGGRGQGGFLDRDADGERRRVRGVPGREGRARMAAAAAGRRERRHQGGGGADRPLPTRLAVALAAARLPSPRHAARRAHRSPVAHPVAQGAGHHDPQNAAVGQPRQSGHDAIKRPGIRLRDALGGGPVGRREPASQGSASCSGLAPGRLVPGRGR